MNPNERMQELKNMISNYENQMMQLDLPRIVTEVQANFSSYFVQGLVLNEEEMLHRLDTYLDVNHSAFQKTPVYEEYKKALTERNQGVRKFFINYYKNGDKNQLQQQKINDCAAYGQLISAFESYYARNKVQDLETTTTWSEMETPNTGYLMRGNQVLFDERFNRAYLYYYNTANSFEPVPKKIHEELLSTLKKTKEELEQMSVEEYSKYKIDAMHLNAKEYEEFAPKEEVVETPVQTQVDPLVLEPTNDFETQMDHSVSESKEKNEEVQKNEFEPPVNSFEEQVSDFVPEPPENDLEAQIDNFIPEENTESTPSFDAPSQEETPSYDFNLSTEEIKPEEKTETATEAQVSNTEEKVVSNVPVSLEDLESCEEKFNQNVPSKSIPFIRRYFTEYFKNGIVINTDQVFQRIDKKVQQVNHDYYQSMGYQEYKDKLLQWNEKKRIEMAKDFAQKSEEELNQLRTEEVEKYQNLISELKQLEDSGRVQEDSATISFDTFLKPNLLISEEDLNYGSAKNTSILYDKLFNQSFLVCENYKNTPSLTQSKKLYDEMMNLLNTRSLSLQQMSEEEYRSYKMENMHLTDKEKEALSREPDYVKKIQGIQ